VVAIPGHDILQWQLLAAQSRRDVDVLVGQHSLAHIRPREARFAAEDREGRAARVVRPARAPRRGLVAGW